MFYVSLSRSMTLDAQVFKASFALSAYTKMSPSDRLKTNGIKLTPPKKRWHPVMVCTS